MQPPLPTQRYLVTVYAAEQDHSILKEVATVHVDADSEYAARLIAVNRVWSAALAGQDLHAICHVAALDA